jgi:anti-sigma factor RsiW
MGLKTTHPQAELLAFVDGRLEAAERARVARHLADCPACRADVFELARVDETLSALPAALRPLTAPAAGSWSRVWVQTQARSLRRVVPQLNFYLSLAAVIFVLAAAVPASLGAQPMPVTAGVIQTPLAEQMTPAAGMPTFTSAGRASTAPAVARAVTAARPVPNETPVPGQKG